MEAQEQPFSQLIRQALGPFGSEAALRACFDPNSGEWDATSMADKVQTLRKCIAAGLDLSLLLRYDELTRRQQGKNFSEAATQSALIQIITHLLTDHSSND
ncbi:hypothetical protein GCM10027594_21270 [Hymenobacter agri]